MFNCFFTVFKVSFAFMTRALINWKMQKVWKIMSEIFGRIRNGTDMNSFTLFNSGMCHVSVLAPIETAASKWTGVCKYFTHKTKKCEVIPFGI